MAYTKTATPIVYYGGKTSILNHTLPLFPEHVQYTEVFFGGGAEFFAKKPSKVETINDKLDLVVNFYQVLKDPELFPQLQDLVGKTLHSKTQHRSAWELIKIHKKHPVPIPNVPLAWAFWIHTNMSFNSKLGSGFRYSNSQHAPEPSGLTNKKKRIIDDDHLCRRMEGVTIENDDALKILESRNVKTAFHRLDPPYPNADQGHYKGYTWAEYKALLQWCGYECKGKFLLSSYNSLMLDVAIETFGWYKTEVTHKLKKPRKSGDAKVEVLVRNYPSPCGTGQLWED